MIVQSKSNSHVIHYLLLIVCLTSAQQYVGDTCLVSSSNSIGECTLAQNCPQAFQNTQKNPDLCSYVQNNAVICCPVSQNNRQGQGSSSAGSRPSQIKCEEYSRLAVKKFSVSPLVLDPEIFEYDVPDCEYTVPLIVDGEKTKPGELPHMAAVGWLRDGKVGYNCGGILISDEFVLTAAHCTSLFGIAPTQVRLGEQNLVLDNDNAQPQDYQISQIIIHPDYQRPLVYNDIALLKLTPKVTFNKFIRPACLWHQQTINVTKAVASGWGLTDFAAERSDELLKALLNIYPKEECLPFFESNRKLPNGITDTQLCAGARGEGHQDTCQGDSGGPIQVVFPGNKCIFHIIGVTSFGKSCGIRNSPGVYTRVSSYLDWLEPLVWPK